MGLCGLPPNAMWSEVLVNLLHPRLAPADAELVAPPKHERDQRSNMFPEAWGTPLLAQACTACKAYWTKQPKH